MKLSLTRRAWLQWLGLMTALGPMASQAHSVPALRVVDRRLAKIPGGGLGGRVIVVDADVSKAWFAQIAPALDRLGAQGQVDGVCQGDALFCLQTLAADRGWRVVSCVAHADRDMLALPAQGLLPHQAYAWVMRPNLFQETL